MTQDKWYIKDVITTIDDKMKERLQLVGEIVSSAAKKNAPVDTGALRDSITFEVNDGEQTVTVGTNVEYAAIVELGLGHLKYPRLFLTHAVQENIPKIKAIFAKRIN